MTEQAPQGASNGGVASLPVIIDMAQGYGMGAQAFVYTFKTVAMPQPHTDPEFVSCCLVAHAHKLNPLTKEIYFMRDKHGRIQAIVGVDGWIKKCNEHSQFDGMEFSDTRGDDGKIVSMTCSIYRKDRSRPTTITEYFAECVQVRDKAGPWQTHPSRQMRTRTLCQCARIAFGFAGIMEQDEFDQWQAMKDVTPKPAAISAQVDDGGVPDIPADDTSDITDPANEHEPLAEGQQELFLEKLKEDVLLCMDDSERATLSEDNSGMLERLSDSNRRRAEAILDGRG